MPDRTIRMHFGNAPKYPSEGLRRPLPKGSSTGNYFPAYLQTQDLNAKIKARTAYSVQIPKK